MSTTPRTTPRAVPPRRRTTNYCDQCGRRLPLGFSTGQVRGPYLCSYACRLAYETPGCKCCGRGVPAYTRLTWRRRMSRWLDKVRGAS